MTTSNKTTTDIDKLAGEKIHELRLAMGLSREQLAGKIDVTHQQLYKYEKGDNRITLGRMVLIAKALKRPISYFIEDEQYWSVTESGSIEAYYGCSLHSSYSEALEVCRRLSGIEDGILLNRKWRNRYGR